MLEAPWRLPKHTALPGDRQWQQEPVPLCTVEVLLFPGPDDWNFSGWDQRTLLMPFHCRERQAGFWMSWYLQPDIRCSCLSLIQSRGDSGCFFSPCPPKVTSIWLSRISLFTRLTAAVHCTRRWPKWNNTVTKNSWACSAWFHGATALLMVSNICYPSSVDFLSLRFINIDSYDFVVWTQLTAPWYSIVLLTIHRSIYLHMYIDSRHIEYINMYMCVCVHGYNWPFLRLVHQFLLHMRRSSADCKAFFRNPGVQMSQSVKVIKYHFLVVWHRWSNST